MRSIVLAIFLFLLGWSGPASAEVEIHFYSKDFGSSFPHGFVRLTGTVDSTGEAIDINYGFTAKRVTPAILTGAVKGKIQTVSARYVSRSHRHFSLSLTEEQYRTVLAVVERWRAMPQPSYALNSRNCVFFVAEVAQALGLDAQPVPRLMRKPKGFLQKVARDNSVLIASWNRQQLEPVAPALTVSARETARRSPR
ncbi:MAG TPA: hypothetical protein VJ597_01315 [Sphingomicrobium sp.]|nr:hypothetical protein [Sphingomicrobium sp.]